MIDPAKIAAAAIAEAQTDEEVVQQVVNFLDPHEMAQGLFSEYRERARQDNTEEYTSQAVQAHHERQAQANYEAMVKDHNRRVQFRKDKAKKKAEKARAQRKKAKKAKKRGR
jgi:hypothetical protein